MSSLHKIDRATPAPVAVLGSPELFMVKVSVSVHCWLSIEFAFVCVVVLGAGGWFPTKISSVLCQQWNDCFKMSGMLR